METSSPPPPPNSVVELNVGGTIYTFNHQTLANSPSGLLQRLFGVDAHRFGSEGVTDSDGRVFLDWDARAFEVVACVLRFNEAIVPVQVTNAVATTTLQYFFDFPPPLYNKAADYLSQSLCGTFLTGIFNTIVNTLRLGNKNYMALPHASINPNETYLRFGIIHEPGVFGEPGKIGHTNTREMVIDVQLNIKRNATKIILSSALAAFSIRSVVTEMLETTTSASQAFAFSGEYAKVLFRHFKNIIHEKNPQCTSADFYAWIGREFCVTDIDISWSDGSDMIMFSVFYNEQAISDICSNLT